MESDCIRPIHPFVLPHVLPHLYTHYIHMVAFLDLPLELLPLIIQHLVRPSHIAAVCLVNRTFYDFMISHLYKRVFVYAWHKEAKLRVCHHLYIRCALYSRPCECIAGVFTSTNFRIEVIKLFTTLAEHPHLAQHVDQLGECTIYVSLALDSAPS